MGQAAHHEQQLQIQKDLEQIIVKAMTEPITQDEAKMLAWASGIKLKESKHE